MGRPLLLTVVGAGVVGLSCAVALREAGFAVQVVAAEGPTTSEVAGGLWLPYATAADERTLGWAVTTYEWLEAAGHPLVDYLHMERDEPHWLGALPPGRLRAARAGELPPGRERGWVARVPLVEVPRHLAALRERAGDLRVRRVASLDDVDGDLVVNCGGVGAAALAGDDTVVPVRGQVVLVRAPAAVPCLCDEDELTYVLPRPDVCVLGGTHQPGDADLAPREHETRDILERCRRLVPALERAEVLGARAGLRPVRRDGVRLEREGRVIHCYGHGGAGITLSWGCAQEVVRLARQA